MSCSNPSNLEIETDKLPRHIAIILDGNGRWAEQRKSPRVIGHRAGVEAVRSVVQSCIELDIKALTLFAFSSENWRRPKQEVGLLMELLLTSLNREVKKLHENKVKLQFIGEILAFDNKLQKRIQQAKTLTADNQGLKLNIALNYGGQWDIVQAVRKIAKKIENHELSSEQIDQETISTLVCLNDLPDVDLFIRTGGEHRISNFLIWQLAYTELYFTDLLWPDFDHNELLNAIKSFASRQRRFGQTSQQVESTQHA